jgi:hypothetical protein
MRVIMELIGAGILLWIVWRGCMAVSSKFNQPKKNEQETENDK